MRLPVVMSLLVGSVYSTNIFDGHYMDPSEVIENLGAFLLLPPPDGVPSDASCRTMFMALRPYRRYLNRLDALVASQADKLVPGSSRRRWGLADIDVSRLPSMIPSLEQLLRGDTSSTPSTIRLIHETQSILRILHDPNPDHVPLYNPTKYSGFWTGDPFKKLSELVGLLRRLRSSFEDEKRGIIKKVLESVTGLIREISSTPEHRIGEELRPNRDNMYFNPSLAFPRQARLSEDPLVELERLTEEFLASSEFCRGWLFRFVPRQTRDDWIVSLHRVYDLVEQVYIGGTHDEHRNVRLIRVSDQSTVFKYIDDVQNKLSMLRDASAGYMNGNRYGSAGSKIHDIIGCIGYRNHLPSFEAIGFEVDTSRVSKREALEQFVRAAEPLRNHDYLTVAEAERFADAARVAYWSLEHWSDLDPNSFESDTESLYIVDREPRENSDSEGETPRSRARPRRRFPISTDLNLTEVSLVVSFLERYPDLQRLLGSMDRPGFVKAMFGSYSGLRLLFRHADEIVILKILHRSLQVAGKSFVIQFFDSNPDLVDRFVTYWENCPGPYSGKYLRVVQRATRFADRPGKLSGLLERVFESGNLDKIRDIAVMFIEYEEQVVSGVEFTQSSKDAIDRFWSAQEEEAPLFFLTYMTISQIMFPERNAQYCAILRNARPVLDTIGGEDLRRRARESFLTRCPLAGTFEERFSTLQRPGSNALKMVVSRNDMLNGATAWFASHRDEIRTRRIMIEFQDEDGYDCGGLMREWTYLLGHKIIEDQIVIEPEPNLNRFIPNPSRDDDVMEFLGMVIARAVRQGVTIPIRFAKVIYRFILEGLDNVELSLDMYGDESPEHARSLRWILENPSSDATQDLSFSVDIVESGVHRVHDLIEGGSGMGVTDDNKAEYVQRVIDFKMRDSIRPQLERFLAGFHWVIPQTELIGGLLSPDELELVVSGPATIDVGDLKRHTTYIGYTETNQQIIWFWEVVESFDQTQLGMLVQFTSGTQLAPVGSFASLPLKIARVGLHENAANHPLPSAHTCTNQLDLPAYTSMEELRDKLVRSITLGGEGFGFA